MKTDFEKLKKLCDENGFELITESPEDNDKFFVVKKKDIWKGVEFVEFHNGSIKKISSINDLMIYASDGKYAAKTNCKPSTEQAYIEQLKKEAFERFGEIKVGDKFTSIQFNGKVNTIDTGIGFYYSKIDDFLSFNGWIIYSKGKWAERVEERITVEFEEVTRSWDNYYLVCFDFTLNKKFDDLDKNGLLEKAGEYLKEQLEKYLNNEI